LQKVETDYTNFLLLNDEIQALQLRDNCLGCSLAGVTLGLFCDCIEDLLQGE